MKIKYTRQTVGRQETITFHESEGTNSWINEVAIRVGAGSRVILEQPGVREIYEAADAVGVIGNEDVIAGLRGIIASLSTH